MTRSAASRYVSSPAYRWYALGVLMLIYLFHSVDRAMPAILTEPIKAEFALSDTQLGIFTGLAYGLSLAACVLPVGALSDRVHRRNLLGLLVILWSACTVIGGFVRNFGQLVLARVGVGAAEAGAAPTAMPMIMDMFPARSRGTAFGLFYASANLGAVVAAAAGGYVAQNYGWRAAMLLAGLPGILAAILLFATVAEPRRGEHDAADAACDESKGAGMMAALRFVARKPALLLLIAGCALMGLISISLGAWAASFFVRVHGLSLSEVGTLIGLFGGIGGVVSPALYGKLADILMVKHPAWPLRLVWISAILAAAAGYVMVFSPFVAVAIIAYGVGEFLRSGYPPPTYSVLLAQTPPQLRGSVMALLQFISVLIGFGAGPVLIGALSDYYGGGTMIRYALATGLLAFVPVIVCLTASSALLYRKK